MVSLALHFSLFTLTLLSLGPPSSSHSSSSPSLFLPLLPSPSPAVAVPGCAVCAGRGACRGPLLGTVAGTGRQTESEGVCTVGLCSTSQNNSFLCFAHVRTHAHTHVHTHIHAHSRARMHARTHARMHTRTHSCARTHACTHAHARTHGRTLTHAHSHGTHQPLCDNHDDGETQALILCDLCGNLCGECDRVLHYRKTTSAHQRQVSWLADIVAFL